jgi:hypothetical protein
MLFSKRVAVSIFTKASLEEEMASGKKSLSGNG